MARIARWCVTHRFVVIAVWLLLLVGTAVGSRRLGTEFTNGFTLPGTELTQALDLLAASSPGAQAGDDTIVFRSTNGRLTDPAVRAEIETFLATVARIAVVTSVRSPFDPAAAGQINGDQTVAYAVVALNGQNQDLTAADVQPLETAASAVRSASLEIEFGGLGFQSLKGSPVAGSELIGILIAAVVLLIAFGSFLSAGVALVAALLAVGTAIELIGLLSRVLPVNALAPTVAALIGLGVAIDYALFVVARQRTGLRSGLSVEEAAVTAVSTAGRAVVFAGGTVSIAMLGLVILQIDFLTGVGIAAAVVVLCAVAAAITLLPALFGLLGLRILGRSDRRRMLEGPTEPLAERGPWLRWATFLRAPPDPPRASSRRPSCCSWPRLRSTSGSVRPIRATTLHPPRRARPTTSWPRALGPARTVPCSSSPRRPISAPRAPWASLRANCEPSPGWPRSRRPARSVAMPSGW